MDIQTLVASLALSQKYTDRAIEQIPNAFVPQGTINFSDLPTNATSDELGFIWNINDSFTTDDRFIEGQGIEVPAHSNVSVVEHEGNYFFDLFHTIDLTNYLAKDNEVEYEPIHEYNPATKKYVDEIEEQLEEDIPGKVSELENDENYQTMDDVNNIVSSHHVLLYSESNANVNGETIPALNHEQVLVAYNKFVAGDKIVIVSRNRDLYLDVIGANYVAEDEFNVSVLYKNSLILFYDSDGNITYKKILGSEAVDVSREYAFTLNDHGYSREWTPNVQGKVWAECGMLVRTQAAITTVSLPVTFENKNYFVVAMPREIGNFHVCVEIVDTHTIKVRATDVGGSPMSINISVEARGWKNS